MSEQLFYRRCFLNDEQGAAVVEAEVCDESWDDRQTGERHPNYSGTLHLTDCSRSIELTLGFYGSKEGPEEVRGHLRKLDRLIDAVQGMRDAMVRAAKREWPGRKF